MNLLQQIQLATQIFLKHSYPDGIPAKIRDKVDELKNIETRDSLLTWSGLEIEDKRNNIRLGNVKYPHMKLVFTLDPDGVTFYVDAHDSHFSLPPDMPGYEQFQKLREDNKKMKTAIEADWGSAKLPVFGQARSTITIKRVCEGMRVLAVDDEPQILDMLKIIVTSIGATFEKALSAEEARKLILENGTPDLLFCDIMMPGESGYDFVGWYKEHASEAPVYFITGLAQEKIGKIKIAEVLQKPFSAKDVIRIMKNLRPAS